MPIGVPGRKSCRTRAFLESGRTAAHWPGRSDCSWSAVDELPDVPALPETLLQMELQLHEFSIDLREISQLILNDVGATLQILRLAARESGGTDGWPLRIEDCISFLGLEACLHAAGRRTVLSEARHRGVIELWAHGREVAHLCRKMAGATDGSIHPEEAWWVGQMHVLGLLPGILGWQWPENAAGSWADKGCKLAELWSLPLCVQEFFASRATARCGIALERPRPQGSRHGPAHAQVSDV